MGESCELSTMNETTSPSYQSTNPTNPFLSGQLQAEDSFTSYQNTYPQQDGAPRYEKKDKDKVVGNVVIWTIYR